MELKDHVALVTGAGRGIGQAIAYRLAEEGACIVVNDIEAKSAEDTAERIKGIGGDALVVRADVSTNEEVRSMFEQAANRFGTIDILVNNAAIGGSSCLVKDIPAKIWNRTLDINLTGAFNCCQAFIPFVMEKRWGKIVNIASLAARRMSKLGGADYTAAKYGLVGFSHHLAFEMAEYGVNVNVICPGPTLTPLVKSNTTDEFRNVIEEQIPLGRWITPSDIAETVLFLVSERAAMITGMVLDVDGGQLLGVASDYREDLQRRKKTGEKNIKAYLEAEGKKL
jgi:NAD(P)-dependent dehydrogenase (short-subunit alcohol dehydrogenase family)